MSPQKPVEQLLDEALEDLKLHAAREIYRKRDQRVPGKMITWREWFKNKFGEDYNEFVARKSAEKDG